MKSLRLSLLFSLCLPAGRQELCSFTNERGITTFELDRWGAVRSQRFKGVLIFLLAGLYNPAWFASSKPDR